MAKISETTGVTDGVFDTTDSTGQQTISMLPTTGLYNRHYCMDITKLLQKCQDVSYITRDPFPLMSQS